ATTARRAAPASRRKHRARSQSSRLRSRPATSFVSRTPGGQPPGGFSCRAPPRGSFLGRQPVADPGLRADPARAVRIVFQLAAKAPHVHPKRVVRDAGDRSPNGGEQLLVCPDG